MLEKMNTKRWIAFGIAILIIGISALSTGLSKKINSEERMKKVEEALLKSLDNFNTNIIEDGDGANRIAVLNVDGVIMNSPQSSFISPSYNHRMTLNALDEVLEDESIKGVLLNINSPGGGVYESAELYRRIDALKEHGKKLYVCMGRVAASGGYYIAAPAEKIYAAPSTLTGSIGVIMGGNNISGLMEKLGISDQTIKSAAHKDIGSATRPMTDDERAILQGVVNDMYNEFLHVVSKGRQMDMEKLRSLADGSVYTGNQAKANGLIDEVGFSEDALSALKDSLGIDNPQVFEYSNELGSSFFSKLFNQKAGDKEIAAKLLLESMGGARPMYLYGGV